MSGSGRGAGAPATIAICVPARDEAARLPRLFDAIERLAVPPGDSVALCLLLDGCTDSSADIAAHHARASRHRVHVARAARSGSNVGVARHAAMALGMGALGAAGDLLLTTDADSWPQPDWLDATRAALDRADLVAGTVIRDGARDSAEQDRIERYYARLYALRRRIDPVDWEAALPHHHASGANLAMRAGVYAALGGFAPLARGEDARLVDDAARAGLRVRRDAASVVYTSDRRHGRARGGLAAGLRSLARTGLAGVRVTHPADELWQYRHHALARRAFAAGDPGALSGAVGLSVDHLVGVARDCPNGEAFAMRVVPVAPGGVRQVALVVAEAALAALDSTPAPARAA